MKLTKCFLNKISTKSGLLKTLNDLKLIDYGSSRACYEINKNFVLKTVYLPRYDPGSLKKRAGISQNKMEVNCFNNSTLSIQKNLAEIFYYSSDYEWIICEQLNPVFINESNHSGLFKKLISFGIYETEEFGKDKNGNIKILDYGLSRSIYDSYYR